MNVLEVRNVTKTFGSLVAVRDVSLNVPKGELRAVIGPNGAGKTTFFNMISGFFRPSAGSIWFDGRDITGLPAHQRVTLGMARTFQITEIFPELTVHENVRIGTEVASGHRLRLTLTTSDLPTLEPPQPDAVNLVGGVYEVQRNQAAASYIELLSVPAARLTSGVTPAARRTPSRKKHPAKHHAKHPKPHKGKHPKHKKGHGHHKHKGHGSHGRRPTVRGSLMIDSFFRTQGDKTPVHGVKDLDR